MRKRKITNKDVHIWASLLTTAVGIISFTGQIVRFIKNKGPVDEPTFFDYLGIGEHVAWILSYIVLIALFTFLASLPLFIYNKKTIAIQNVIWIMTAYMTIYLFQFGMHVASAVSFLSVGLYLAYINGYLHRFGEYKALGCWAVLVVLCWFSPSNEDPILTTVGLIILAAIAVMVLKMIIPFEKQKAEKTANEEALEYQKQMDQKIDKIIARAKHKDGK